MCYSDTQAVENTNYVGKEHFSQFSKFLSNDVPKSSNF